MTLVLGITTPRGVLLAADTAGTGWTQHTTTHPKIAAHGPIGIGYAGSFRMGQVLRYCIDWDAAALARNTADPHEWAVRCIVPAIRKTLATEGIVHTKEATDRAHGQIMLALDGRAFTVQSDFSVLEAPEHYVAIGSGGEVALGALHGSTQARSWAAARKLALKALEAAEHYIPSVRGPFHVAEVAK